MDNTRKEGSGQNESEGAGTGQADKNRIDRFPDSGDIDRQEGEMNNGELGGNFNSTANDRSGSKDENQPNTNQS